MLLFFKTRKICISLFIFLLLFNTVFDNVFAEVIGEPGKVVDLFTKHIKAGRYAKAYSLFSKGLKQEVTFKQFKKGFSNVKTISILQKTLIEKRYNIARIKLKVASSEIEDRKIVKREYFGNVVLIQEEKQWKLLQLLLEEIVLNGQKDNVRFKKIKSL